MALFGDSITTDHISPAGAIKESSPAGQWLLANGVAKADFNSYGSRRGNHDVMMRGTFANVRIKNLMVPPGADGSREEGGVTLFQPERRAEDVHLRRGHEVHGGTACRPWCSPARNTAPARSATGPPRARSCWASRRWWRSSFERIHRSNLVGMGVLPLQFKGARLVADARA